MSVLTTAADIHDAQNLGITTNAANDKTKFCFNCKHHVFPTHLGHLCYVRNEISLITAELVPDFCTDMRRVYGDCGPEGTLFEPA